MSLQSRQIQQRFHDQLDAIYGKDEVDSFFYLLTEHFFQLTRLQLALNSERIISNSEVAKMLSALNQLKQEVPIQYIIGETEFFGLTFKVSSDVLIPRPETEELVQWVINEVVLKGSEEPQNVLDIGTGSGCIAISLAKHLPRVRVNALDVSVKALQVAKENARLNNVNVEFIEVDILNNPVIPKSKFNVIVSNPPYVRKLEKEEMQNNVLKNEPHLALFVDNDNPLQFYKAIIKIAVDKLYTGGLLFFEINEYLGNEMIMLLKQFGFKNIQLKQDIFGKDRMIKAER